MGRLGRAASPLVVAIEGASGAGKSAVSAELAGLLGASLVREAYDRIGRMVSLEVRSRADLADLERALLDAEGRRWVEIGRLRASGHAVVLDTSTVGPITYSWGLREAIQPEWDVAPDLARRARHEISAQRWGLADLTLYLDVPEGIAADRAARAPETHDPAFAERHRLVGRFERLLYTREFPRRFPGRFGVVAGEGTPREVAFDLQERLERLGPFRPWSPPEEERFLDQFEGAGPSPPIGPSAPGRHLNS